jgi:hypothetical protein
MSRSEDQALADVETVVAAGVMSGREAEYWRAAVKDPCGCAEGLLGAALAAAAAAAVRHDSLGEVVVSGTVGLAVGAVAGKVLGVAKGLHLVQHQRAELGRRLAELTERPARPSRVAEPRTP